MNASAELTTAIRLTATERRMIVLTKLQAFGYGAGEIKPAREMDMLEAGGRKYAIARGALVSVRNHGKGYRFYPAREVV